jgi:hypothetical protein
MSTNFRKSAQQNAGTWARIFLRGEGRVRVTIRAMAGKLEGGKLED